MADTLDAALEAHAAGLAAIPAAVDGTKAPLGSWRRWQHEQPSLDQLETWFAGGHPGIGLVCGQVSGGLELLEFEGRAVVDGTWDGFIAAAEGAGLLDLVDRITDGYLEETPSGGYHLLYRCPTGVEGNQKLARRPATDTELETNPDETVKILIETRGEGGFVITAPSNGTTHPSGRPWELLTGSLSDIVTITADERRDLHELARSFDQLPDATHQRQTSRQLSDPDGRPGDDYNQRATWDEVLEPHGWTFLYSRGGIGYWRRPGKTRGVSATTNATGNDTLKVFSTSTPFDTETTYDRFGAYAVLEHAGDLTIAARHLRQAGYGNSSPPRPPTTTTAEGDAPDSPPVVVINNRPLRDVTGDLIAALDAANQPPVLFVRGGQLTRVRLDEKQHPIIETLGDTALRNRLARVADTVRILKDGDRRHTPPPFDAVKDLAANDNWPFPPLEGIVEIPTLRPNGTIHTDAGYDPTTRLLHRPAPNLVVPPIPERPDQHQTNACVAVLDELLHDFPFETDADRANAIGLLLTPLVRPAINGQTPLALIDSPEPGTGKGLLANLAAIIATGRQANAQPYSRNDEEVRKLITATLDKGSPLVVFDNIESTIRSSALSAALTADMWADRILGQTEIKHLPNRTTWIATGNNIAVGGDLGRRCYRIRLDAHQARPYLRRGFLHEDLPGWTLEHRGPIVAALLGLARSWWAAGQPDPPNPQALGGFTAWSKTIGGILHQAGITGFLTNFIAFVEELDVESAEWEAFLAAWHQRFADRPLTIAELVGEIEHTGVDDSLTELLPGPLAEARGSAGFNKRLGHAFRIRAGRHYGSDGWHLVRAGKTRSKIVQWRVGHGESVERGVRGVPRGSLSSSTREKSRSQAHKEKTYRDGETEPRGTPRTPRPLCADCQTPDVWITDADTNDPLCRPCARDRGEARLATEQPDLLHQDDDNQ